MPEEMHADLRSFMDFWRVKKGERRMPSMHELDLLEIPHLAGGLFIIDITYQDDQPVRFQYRHAGLDIVDTIGMEITGRFLDEIFPPENYKILVEDYQDAILHCQPSYMSFLEAPAPNAMILYERLLLPIGPDGAARPTAFIGMHARTAKGTAKLADSCHPFVLGKQDE